MTDEHPHQENVPQTDPNATSSTQAYPDSQEPAQTNAPRTDHHTISPLGASLEAENVDKANVPQGTLNPTSFAQKYSASPGGIWVFTWNEIINGFIQVIAVIAALVFGAWAIKSYETAQQANALARTSLQQTVIANQLALLVGCASNQEISNSTACADVLAAISLNNIVFALGLVPAVPLNTTTTSPPTASSLPSTTTPPLSTPLPPVPPPPTSLPPPSETSNTATGTSTFATTIPSLATSTITTTPAQSSNPTTQTSRSSPSVSPKPVRSPSLQAIIGIVVGIVCVVAFLVAGYIGVSRGKNSVTGVNA